MKTRIIMKLTARALTALVMLMAPVLMMWGQETNEKFSMTTQMFLNSLKEQTKQPTSASHRAHIRRMPNGKTVPMRRRLIASPDTVGGVAYISCFIHLKDADELSAVRALGVEVDESFDGLDFVTARVPVDQLEPLAAIDNVTRIKVARHMRPLTDVARQTTNVEDLLTESPDALALGVTGKYDGTGVILGIIDTGIDFQHVAFKDKDGNSRIKRAYVYSGSGSGKEYTNITTSAPTTDDKNEDHGTHTATTAGGSSVIVSGSTVTVTDDHANATFGGMAPGADLYLAGINGLKDTELTKALEKMVNYAEAQGKPLVVSNSWGSGWGPRDGTGDFATVVSQYFGKDHPNRVILFASSNDAGHRTGDEGGGFFVRKSGASSTSPLGTIIRTEGEGGGYYTGLIACAWASVKLNCKLYVLDSNGEIKKTWTVTNEETTSFSGLSKYYDGSMAVYIEEENGKYRLAVYSEDGLETEDDYTLAIEVYPANGSADVNMWAGDWSYFTDHLTTDGHPWTDGTDDMCVSDEATIADVISVGAYVTKDNVKNYEGKNYSYSSGTVGDIAYYSSYATAELSPTGQAYPWITAPGAQIVAGVNHYDTSGEYSYYKNTSELVVNSRENPYGVMEGTSMATPVAAGIVALWLQAALEANKTLTVNDVKEIMDLTAIKDEYTAGANASHFGHGKIDALAGIQHILGTTGGPVIKATPSSINFGSNTFVTRTYTKTLHVRGFNLENDINVSINDNANYTLSQTSITQGEAAEGVDIIITYAPLTDGSHEATVTLSTDNVKDVEVPLTATAKPAIPTIVADPEALTFAAGLDEQKSLTIDVLGEFLKDDITVTLTDADGVFAIDKTSVNKEDSEEGATVTVTFQSADAGTFTGTVTLSSTETESVTIALSATASAVLDETIVFSEQGFENGEDVESVIGANCTATFDEGSNNRNAPKYYDNGDAVRLYGGNTMTIASDAQNIVEIELIFGTGDGNNGITTNVGTYETGTWTGNAKAVTFTISGNSGHRRIQKVKVVYEGGGGSTPPGPIVSSGRYELVKNASTLKAGDNIVIAYINGGTSYALSTTQKENNRAATDDLTLNRDGTFTPGKAVQIITLEKSGNNYLFNVGNGYLYAASSEKNWLKTKKEADANAQASISISSDGSSATIKFQGKNTRNTMRYNPNTTNAAPLFSCYASNATTGSAPQIYREVTTPVISKGDVNGYGGVDEKDVMITISYILGHTPEGFIEAAADMNGDHVIDIVDVAAMISVAKLGALK